MQAYLIIFLGGGLGAAARHFVGAATGRSFGHGFPIGTLTVNVIGSLFMGVLIGWLAQRALGNMINGQDLRLFLATGFLGGFTTFSAFSLDAITLWERGATGLAAGYVVGSVVLSVLAVFFGLAIARALFAG
ncbi:MAG: fluoride efflux transporter CrcB [Pseudomonadota bacterium]